MKKINWINIIEGTLVLIFGTVVSAAFMALPVYLYKIVIGEEKPSPILWIISGVLLIFILLIVFWRRFRDKSKELWQLITSQWRLITALITIIFEVIGVNLTANILEIVIVLISSFAILLLTRSHYLSLQQSQKGNVPSKLIYQFLFVFITGVIFTFTFAQFINIDLTHRNYPYDSAPTPTTQELLRVNPDKFAEIVFVIDTTDSYYQSKINYGVGLFVEKLLPKDRIGLVSYSNNEAKTVFELDQIGDINDEMFMFELNDLQYSGTRNSFYDAIIFSTTDIKFQRNNYKSVIILVNNFRLKPSEANYQIKDVVNSIEQSTKNGTLIFTFSLGSNDSTLLNLIGSATGTEVYDTFDSNSINDLMNKYLQ